MSFYLEIELWGHICKKAMISSSSCESQDLQCSIWERFISGRWRKIVLTMMNTMKMRLERNKSFCVSKTKKCATIKKYYILFLLLWSNMHEHMSKCIIDIIQIHFLWLYTQSSFSFLKLRKLGLGRKLCATNRLCGICCFCDFPAPQEWRQLPIFIILVFILE